MRKIDERELRDWLELPVTRSIQEALVASLERQSQACKDAYFAGNPWTESERLALLRVAEFLDDMFHSTADDFNALMEKVEDEQQERDQSH